MAQFDPGILNNKRSLLDYQRLQQDFELKKAMATAQLENAFKPDDLSIKDLLTFQMAQQNHTDTMGMRQQEMMMRQDLARENNQAKSDLMREKLDEKKNQKMLVDQNLLGSTSSSIDTQLGLIDQVLGKVGPDGKPLVNKLEGVEGNFGLRGVIPNLPGSDAANAAATLDRLDAKSFIDSLGAMKAQSATGASGLGSATEREGDKVQAAAAALKRSQDYPSFVANLKIYQKELNDSKARLQGSFNNIYGGGNINNMQAPTSSNGGGLSVTISPADARAELARRAAARGQTQ